MTEPQVVHSTFLIERSFTAAPDKVFAAFAQAEKKRRWFAEGKSHIVEAFEIDFREGGQELARYRFKEGTPFPGVLLVSTGIYEDIVVDRRIVTASTMTIGGKRISAALVTIELLPNGVGTDLICTHQGAFFEGADGPEMREDGWQKLLGRLAEELEHQPVLA